MGVCAAVLSAHCDVGQDGDRLVEGQLAVLLEVVTQGLLGAGHHQYPLVFVLAAVDDRHHVTEAVQINEEHLGVSARRLGYELHRRLLAGGVLRLEHGAKAATLDAGADGTPCSVPVFSVPVAAPSGCGTRTARMVTGIRHPALGSLPLRDGAHTAHRAKDAG
ncbi:hypothetical protein [Streptomyces massasporeus]|uniref:hypothetical protein n=1 Tax=Streptomyces massasporeus TaxID=67324 RepID=UPI00368BB27E